MDVDARIQLFDLKTTYKFQTSPGVDRYNMPLYSIQTSPNPPIGGQVTNTIGMFPVYQGFTETAYINGIQVPFQTQKTQFENIWPNVVQNMTVIATGNGTAGPYTLTFPVQPNNSNPVNTPVNAILRGHVDITGIISLGQNVDPPIADNVTASSIITSIPTASVDSAVYITSMDANGANVVVRDSGVFFRSNNNSGLLMTAGPGPFGNAILPGGYSAAGLNQVNYFNGTAIVTFPVAIPQGININAQTLFFQTGLPRAILYYNNVLTLRSPPDQQYLVEIDAYLSPAAFLTTGSAIPFGYMAEYIARGAARKILSDTGDWEQFTAYEPLFKEQESLVWKRSQRQFTTSRTQTIYSQGINQGQSGFNNIGGSTI